MPKADPIQQSFVSGELSPRFKAQANTEIYRAGVESLINYLPLPSGPIVRRQGTRWVYRSGVDETIRLVPFLTETGGDLLVFRKDNTATDKLDVIFQNGTITAALTLAHKCTSSEYFDGFQSVQQGGSRFFASNNREPFIIQRSSLGTYSEALLRTIFAQEGNGPYDAINDTATTVTPGAIGPGSGISLTASAALFNITTDVNRQIRLQDDAGNWTWATITAVSSTTIATIHIKGPALANTNATSNFAFSMFYGDSIGAVTSGVSPYPPKVIAFHENRLVLAGYTGLFPNQANAVRVDLSRPAVYSNFEPTEADGTVDADTAISVFLNANEYEEVVWCASDERGLIVGTTQGEWLVSSSDGGALTSANVFARKLTHRGNSYLYSSGVKAEKSTLSASSSAEKLRRIIFVDSRGGFVTDDISNLSEHILKVQNATPYAFNSRLPLTGNGIREITIQQEPFTQIWMSKRNGELISALFTPDLEDRGFYGPARHILGGVSTQNDGNPVVTSIVTVPDGSRPQRDVQYLSVRRLINGELREHVEYFTKEFESDDDIEDANYLDSSILHDSPQTISTISKANPAVITTSSPHGFSNGDQVKISNAQGMANINGIYLIKNITATTMELTDLEGTDINSTAFNTYLGKGEVRKYVTAISGLTHLEGETVDVVGDGIYQGTKVVASGAITIDTAATIVHVGYKYNSDVKLLPFDFGSATGTALGKTQRIHRLGIDVYRTRGLKAGSSFDSLYDFLSTSGALTSGWLSQVADFNYELGNQVCIRQSDPVPGTIRGVTVALHTQDR